MRRPRRVYPIPLIGALLAAPLAADAQQPAITYRIGVLTAGSPATPSRPSRSLDSFRERLHELGYVEGRNIAIEYRWAEGWGDRFPGLAAELVRLKVDVIVAGSFPGAQAAKEATSTIPIVTISADPVGTGLVASLARPVGNVTGFSYMTPELTGKRLEFLKATVTRLARVGVLWNSTNSHEVLAFRELEVAAKSLRVTLHPVEVRAPNELEAAFSAMARERADALIVFENLVNISQRRLIADFAGRSRLPAIYERREFVHDGGLMAYGPSVPEMYRRAAVYVDKILKGVKPADLPVEQPTRFELVINMRTARALSLTIPSSLLAQADEVIE
jgi:putative ABC transport system substrate-binding protein